MFHNFPELYIMIVKKSAINRILPSFYHTDGAIDEFVVRGVFCFGGLPAN